MMKKTLLFLSVLLLIGAAFAYETPLTNFGFISIDNNTSFTKLCKEITVNLPTQAITEKGVGILSLNANFVEDANDSTYVSLSVNGGAEMKLWQESFDCNEQCFARVFVPNIKKGETKLNICAVLGGASKRLTVNQDSLIGIYDSPVLSIQNTAQEKIFLGDRARMDISVTNSGTKAASIFVQFVHPDTRAKVTITSFDIVEGDSSANTVIAPNETKNFVYYIKPSKVSGYNLPLAALFFKNIFNENQTIFSEHPYLDVVERKQIEVSLVSITDQDPRTFKAIVKNNFDTEFNGTITITPQTEFTTYSQSFLVMPKSEKEITFVAKPLPLGKYVIQATVRDANQIYSSNQLNIESTKQEIPLTAALAIVAVIIGAIIFGWIYFSKS